MPHVEGGAWRSEGRGDMRRHGQALMIVGVVTALTGLIAAFGLAGGLPVGQRGFAAVSIPVQLLISVGVPFLGVVMSYDLHRQRTDHRIMSTLLRVVALGAGSAIFGSVVTASAVAVFTEPETQGRWDHAVAVVLGSILVQVVAGLTGTGWGLLIQRAVLACLATVVIPLGLWAVLGELAPPLKAWLTPLESANALLGGTMVSSSWLPYAVMVGLWCAGLNLAGYRRFLGSQHPVHPSADRTVG